MIKEIGGSTGTTSQVQTVDAWNGSHYLIYSGQGPYGNREHVIPNSYLKIAVGSSSDQDDLHNLRASNSSINSSRANLGFTYGSGGYGKVNGKWYPGDEHIGDVARIVLYTATRYNVPFGQSIGSYGPLGDLSMFIEWHLADPVSEFEITRNDRIYSIQGNRNPFIDYPEFVELMWPNIANSYQQVDNFNMLVNYLDTNVSINQFNNELYLENKKHL